MVRSLTLAILLTFLFSPLARADLALHSLFTDHAVFQRDLPVPIWGTGWAGDTVTVEFAGQKKETTVADDETWLVTLEPLKASSDPRILKVSSAADILSVSDVLVGEVWVGSGQSNMAMSVNRTSDAELVAKEAKAGHYADIRLFKVSVEGADQPATNVNANWQLCDERTTAGFSATAFYFGRSLHEALEVPVGLIQSAMGGTNAYSWIDNDTFKNDPAAAVSREWWKSQMEDYPRAQAAYEKRLTAWEKEKQGRRPRAPEGPDHVKRPTGHYNAMIAPLQPYAIRGAIWYQGERNSRPPFADQYRDLMLALIEDWRANWPAESGLERRDFPFFVVQLPNYGGGSDWGWPVIREQMLKVWQDGKNTGAVVTIDVGDASDIHPTSKRPVGERLARFAEATVYGEDIEYSGPIYSGVEFENGKAVVSFNHTGSGLMSKDDKPLRHFAVAGEDGVFHDAKASIDGNKVVVQSEEVSDPAAVRYAWSNNPEPINFYNREGLPASPFRTDTAPIPAP